MKKTFDFDFKSGEFNMKNGNPVVLEGVDALKMWIQKCIRTQLNRYSIYKGKQYGANIEDLVISSHFRYAKSQPDGCPPFLAVSGKSYGNGFAESELRHEIEEALLRHEDILSLSDFSVSTTRKLMEVSFTLVRYYRAISMTLQEMDNVKDFFDRGILNKDYTGLETYILEIPESINFANYAYFAPDFDINGNKVKYKHQGFISRLTAEPRQFTGIRFAYIFVTLKV